MREPADALRSVKAYAAEILGSRWEVRDVDEEGVFDRPLAMVHATTIATVSGAAVIMDYAQSFQVHLWPTVGPTTRASAANAMEAEERLAWGLRNGVGLGGPMRIPLRDYRQRASAGLLDAGGAMCVLVRERHPGLSTLYELSVADGTFEARDRGKVILRVPFDSTAGLAEAIDASRSGLEAERVTGNLPVDAALVPLGGGGRVSLDRPASAVGGGYLRVSDVSTNRMRDDSDALLWEVVVALRAEWRVAREGRAAPLVDGVTVEVEDVA